MADLIARFFIPTLIAPATNSARIDYAVAAFDAALCEFPG